MKQLPRALLLALLVGTPVIAQNVTWDVARDFYLGPGRMSLMGRCGFGKSVNLNGVSVFNKEYRTINRKFLLEDGASEQLADTMQSGMAAAMAIACPNVW